MPAPMAREELNDSDMKKLVAFQSFLMSALLQTCSTIVAGFKEQEVSFDLAFFYLLCNKKMY